MDIEIKLTQGQATFIDPADADLAKMKWCARRCKFALTYYAMRSKKGTILLHREVLSRMLGRPLIKGEQVDHIDGDGLNNRRSNLRLATSSQNNANRGLQSNSSSGYNGVGVDLRRGLWSARIKINRKTKHLGYFDNILDAVRAYDIACVKHFKEFARPNYPAAAYGLAEWPDS